MSLTTYQCEYCGCRTNARQRFCCDKGRDADKATWAEYEALPHTESVGGIWWRCHCCGWDFRAQTPKCPNCDKSDHGVIK